MSAMIPNFVPTRPEDAGKRWQERLLAVANVVEEALAGPPAIEGGPLFEGRNSHGPVSWSVDFRRWDVRLPDGTPHRVLETIASIYRGVGWEVSINGVLLCLTARG